MIDIAELLTALSERDVRVSLDGDGLRVIAPTGTMTEDRVAYMRQYREAIIEFLRAEERDRVRVLVLLSEPRPNEPDNADPAEGQSIIAAVEKGGGWLAIEHRRIVLRWKGDFPGKIIDQIMAARTTVVRAVENPS